MANHTLRIIKGNKANPTSVINLADVAGGIMLNTAGFAPNPGKKDDIWTGRTSRRDGQQLVTTSRDNAEFELEYTLHSDSYAGLMALQVGITQILDDAERYELRREGEPVWLEYGWGNAGTTQPTNGQLNHFCRIKAYDVEWPKDLHTAGLVGFTIERARMTLTCEPYSEGIRQQAIPVSGAVVGPFSIVGMFPTTAFTFSATITAPNPLVDFWLLQIYQDSTHHYSFQYDASPARLVIVQSDGGSASTLYPTSSGVISAGEEIDFTLTYNGTDDPTVTIDNDTFSALPGFANVDNVTSWTATATYGGGVAASSVTDVADAESVNTGDAMITVTFDNDPIENTEGNNYFLIQGVPGDLPAITEWRITPPTSSPMQGYWLGLKPVDTALTNPAVFWLEFSGTAVAGTSGGEYERVTGTVKAEHDSAIASDIDEYQGRYQVLGNFKVSTNSLTGKAFYRFGTAAAGNVYGPTEFSIGTGGFYLRDFGELFVRWFGDENHEPAALTIGLETTPTTGTSARDLDFLMLLPYPNLRVISATSTNIAISSGDTITILNEEAWIKTSTNSVKNILEVSGKVELLPNKLNYVYLLQGKEEAAIDVSDTATVEIYVTPRYLLPGVALA